MQGGKCLSHGAKRRICKFPKESCNKNAIVGGMCKKHYDMMKDANGLLDCTFGAACVPIMGSGSEESEGTEVSDMSGYAYHQGGGQMNGYEENVKPPAPPVMMYQAPPAPLPPQQVYYEPTPPTVTMPSANVQNQNRHQGGSYPPVTYRPPLRKKNKHPRHQRGLSIFEDMGTVDAIINSGAAAANQQAVVLPVATGNKPSSTQTQAYGCPTPDPAAEVMPPPPPPRHKSLPQVPNMATGISTRTPAPQVSFADCGTKAHPEKPASKPDEDFYSPTIAIFEQMIKASEVIDNPNNSQGYSGFSPPKLTPRGRRQVSFHQEVNDVQAQAPPAAAQVDNDLQRTISHDDENAHHMHQAQVSHRSRVTSPTNDMLQPTSYAPETPDLNGPSEPMNIVSAGSYHGNGEQQAAFLPKRNVDHLFIPSALS